MFRRSLVLLLCLGALAQVAPTQDLTPGRVEPLVPDEPVRTQEAGAAPSGSVVTIGDGLNSTGTFNGVDQMPFVAALAALPAGGTIRVGAGLYRFTAPLVVTTPRIVLEGPAATLVASKAPFASILDIQAPDVEIRGFQIRKDKDNTAFHALVRVESSRVRIRDCSFSGVDTSGTPQFILLGGDGDERWVQDNRFKPGFGWTCVRAEGGRGLHLTGNSVIGESGLGRMSYGFHLVDETWSEISGNTFVALGSDEQPVEAVVLVENPVGEGHHSVVSDNMLHLINARRGIHLAGAQFSVVSGNAIGRLFGAGLQAMLEIDSGPQGAGAKSVSVTGNEFHNSTGAPMIRLNGVEGVTVTGNQFGLVSTTAVRVGDLAPAKRVTVAMNSFRALPAVAPVPAVRIHSGTGHVVIGNSFEGFLVSAIDTTGVAPAAIVLDLNIGN